MVRKDLTGDIFADTKDIYFLLILLINTYTYLSIKR